MSENYKSIFNPAIVRALLKKGHKIVDIKPDKGNKDKTIFIFEVNENFIKDLDSMLKH